jgi:hypothetical protein
VLDVTGDDSPIFLESPSKSWNCRNRPRNIRPRYPAITRDHSITA